VATTESTHTLPYTEQLEGYTVEYRLMTPDDRDKLLEFTRTLPKEDLMYLRMDVTNPEVIDHWVDNIRNGLTITVLGFDDDGHVIGYGSLHHNKRTWTRHMGELRMLASPEYRGIGLGKRLTNEVFQIAKDSGLLRVFCQIPADQPHVREMLEKMGFISEALLTDWLMGQDNQLHDVVVMTQRVVDYHV
jgi:GNAT superfamily N-acetyltransferase